MKLTTPIYHLKRQARILSRDKSIPLHEALDRLAKAEGYESWSLLMAKHADAPPAKKLYDRLKPGELILIAARPGQGKTLMSLELAIEAMQAGNRAFLFSLEFTAKDCEAAFVSLGHEMATFDGQFEFDGSDTINAEHIRQRLSDADKGTFVIVDYLQALDQRRENPPLDIQIRSLSEFARERGLIMAFIGQIHRSFDPESKEIPDLNDIRLPNPFDLKIFDRTCFLHDGKLHFG